MDALTKLIVLSQLFLRAIVAIDLTCDSVNPLIQSNATCICTNAPATGIDWYLDDAFHSSCVLSTICVPQYSGYSYSINMTENVYKMTMNSYNYSDCTKITCKDPSDGSIMQSKVPPSIVFDTTFPTSMSEPGSNNTNGIISVTTGCISGFSDLKYDWFIIVEGLEEKYSVDESSKIDTNDTSSCTNCNTNENGKRTIGFQHKETSGSGTKAVLFKVLLQHTSTHLQLNITSSYYYTVKVTSEDSDDSEDSKSSTGAIVGIVFGVSLVLTPITVWLYLRQSGIPKDFTHDESSVTNNSFKVLWTPVTNGESNVKYLLVWSTVNENKNMIDIPYNRNNKREYVLQNLEQATTYKVKIRATVKCVASKFTKPLTVKTLETPAMPKDFTFYPKNVTKNSVVLSWKPGVEEKALKHTFDLIWYKDQSKQESTNISHDGSSLMHYYLKDLCEGTDYSATICAKHNNAKSEYAAPISFKTLSKPDTPKQFRCDDVTKQSILVRWKKGYDGGCKQSFHLECENKSNGKTDRKDIDTDTSETMQHKFMNLTENSVYKLTIYSFNKHGQSSKQTLDPIFTHGNPASPIDFELGTVTENSIEVKWTPGYNGRTKQIFILKCLGLKEKYKKKIPEDRFEMKHTFKELTPGKGYTISIEASNAEGNTPCDKQLIVDSLGSPETPSAVVVQVEKGPNIKRKSKS